MTVHSLNPRIPMTAGPVRPVAVVSRCRTCHREFRVAIDADGQIPIEAYRCGDPRCQAIAPPPAAA